MVTRRQFFKYGAGLGIAIIAHSQVLAAPAATRPATLSKRRRFALSGGSLDPNTIAAQKFTAPLIVPPAMPITSKSPNQGKTFDYYEIAVRQFQQQVLPNGFPPTTVWSYGSVNHAGTFNFPAFTIEATVGREVRVKWINGLVDAAGNYLPHLLAVDQTLHWANPPGGQSRRDTRPTFKKTPPAYTGPVPIVTHVHGAHVAPESDGYPEAWYLPAAKNIPAGYATTGTFYDIYKKSSPLAGSWGPGNAVFGYRNDQRASTLWYHDHALGLTRLNVYAGPAGFYNLRGGPSDLPPGALPGPAPMRGDAPGTAYYEIPIAIQDRSFNADGSLFYPDSRQFFDEFDGPFIPDSDMSPIWNPETFGNTLVVNGRAWPYLDVEPRRYRFRFLNGCQARFLILKLDQALPFWQIGNEGGFLPAPVQLEQLLVAPAERADVIVDFSGLTPGTTLTLQNLGPDEPFNGGDFDPADPNTTGQVMQFRVVPLKGSDTSLPPAQLTLPAVSALGGASQTRQVSINELDSEVLPETGPREAELGTLNPDGTGNNLPWMAAPTETPALNATEVWEIYNFTEDAHPIHLHQVQFQVLGRAIFDPEKATRPTAGPEAWETGFKDTVVAYPGMITRVKARFDIAGRYVWHCHILEHEDNEMMRPFQVA